MMGWTILGLVVVIAGLALCYFAMRAHVSHAEQALEILRKRFARGEISRDEFEHQRRVIEAGAASGVLVEHVVRRALEVVELPALQRAPERPAGQEYEGDRERNEKVEAFHRLSAASGRKALRSTVSELAPMASAASQGPIHPLAASGSATAL